MSDYDYDSGNESSNVEDDLEDDDGVLLALEPENNSLQDGIDFDDDYPHRVLSTDDIMMHMIDTIREVNTVVQVFGIIKVQNFSKIKLFYYLYLASSNYYPNIIKPL